MTRWCGRKNPILQGDLERQGSGVPGDHNTQEGEQLTARPQLAHTGAAGACQGAPKSFAVHGNGVEARSWQAYVGSTHVGTPHRVMDFTEL